MTRDQGVALWNAARRLEKGDVIVEIGSHQGRSTIVLGSAARTVGATVIAVDPFVDGKLFGGTKLRPDWDRALQLLYIDGKHDYWTYTDDLKWSVHLPEGGEILVHDCFSSIGVTLGTIAKVLFGRRYVYVDRATSLARFRLAKPTAADRLRVLAQMPWFLRNVVIKVLLRLKLRPVARVLGHDSPYDPY